ncbi:chemotaxis protein CheW [Sulfuriflexus sp.]|uniref:chemotaxis protein CheW n=1 Tax=Sulfuriflexus sp. TaxID=2015443 RepID=UPI0028CC359C|nr:chemotaxis protein CheW [Sulfuriflexus sp.]MDT8403129.1 chemotaxis protein CheW [Sulfuriflexus sp.]
MPYWPVKDDYQAMNAKVKKIDPIALLREIERRSIKNAAGLPQQEELKSTSLAIGFRIGGLKMVTPVDEVTELLTYPAMSRVPGTKTWVRGIANVRGNLLPIMDLQDYLTKQPTVLTVKSRVLVVNHGGIFSGLLVDEVLGLRHFQDEERKSKLPEVDNFIKSYLSGAYQQDTEEWGIFSMHALAKSPLFLQVAV